MIFKKVQNCRICGSDELDSIGDLGEIASCGIFPDPRRPDSIAQVMPMELLLCKKCGLTQLAHNYDLDHLFRDSYGYRSGLNESMIEHLRGIVGQILSRVEIDKDDLVLDIGSNDGTTLGFYLGTNCNLMGMDPTAEQFRSFYDKKIKVIPDFFSSKEFYRHEIKQPKVITSIAMFYDLPNPREFVKGIQDVLHPEGIWVFEQSYLPSMIERSSFDTVCHEHLEYYCLKPVLKLLNDHGIKVIDVELNEANGGSFRVTAAHKNSKHQVNQALIDAMLKLEEDRGYLTEAPVRDLLVKVQKMRSELVGFLQSVKDSGAIVHGYGASTKGNVLLQLFGLNADLLPCIADRNPRKFGCFTPGSNIPIVSEEDSRSLKPDYYLALPWHFKDSFLAREKEFLDRGGKFIFPLPNFEVVGR